MFIFKIIKYLLILTFLTFVGSCVSVYFAFKAVTENPDLLPSLIDGIAKKIPQIEMDIRTFKSDRWGQILGDSFGQEMEFNETKIESLEGISNLYFKATNSDVEILESEEDDLQIHYSGTAYVFPNNSLIQMKKIDQDLKLVFSTAAKLDQILQGTHREENEEPLDIQSKIEIMIPKSFRGQIFVQNIFGDIQIFENSAKSYDIKTEWGDISFQTRGVQLYEFDLSSQMGNIVNESKMGADNRNETPGLFKAQTKKGDITVSPEVLEN